jgi:hypothetical protein
VPAISATQEVIDKRIKPKTSSRQKFKAVSAKIKQNGLGMWFK